MKNKVTVITGAGRGIGRALALGFAGAGSSVVCSARTEAELKQTVGEIASAGGRAAPFVADVRDFTAMQNLFAFAVKTFGGIDVVVINAGVGAANTFIEDSDPAAWQQVINVNLVGVYNTAKAAIPYLKARGAGKIITIGSGIGHRGSAGKSAYAVSKAGSWMLTRVLAQELAPFKISVNELVPGPVYTAMNPAGQFKPEGEWYKQAEDVVPLALFLASQPDIGPTAQSFSLMRRDK